MTEALSAADIRARYGIDPMRIYRWKAAGKVTPVKPAQDETYPLDVIQRLNRAAEAHPRAKRVK